MIVTGFGESSNLVSESKMFVKDEAKVSSRVGGVESSEELCILASWFSSPMSKNSVLEELRVKRLAVSRSGPKPMLGTP